MLRYTIKPLSIPQQTLSVALRIDRLPRLNAHFRLCKGATELTDLACRDAKNQSIDISESNGLVDLEPLRVSAPLTITYTAKLGSLGRHGHRGALAADMAVFDGDHVLLFPEVTVNGSDSAIACQIARITIDCEFPSNGAPIVPYPAAASGKGRFMTTVASPTFFAIYQLVKSCYAFGAFDTIVLQGRHGPFTAAIDPVCRRVYSDSIKQGITALYEYYAGLFGSEPPAFTLALLRPDSGDGKHVMGGVGMNAVGSTFDPDDKRDWELLAHRFFHVFIDNRMPASLFHKKRQLWFYEGLATYYENVALGSLPAGLRRRADISVGEGFLALARRYVYMRLKDPRLAVAPMDEPSITSAGLIEFLHYTQAPLIVKLLEDRGCAKFGGHDRLLRFVIDNWQGLSSMEPVFSFGVTEERDEFLKRYLFGKEVLPVWNLAGGAEDSAVVISQLTDFGRLLAGWFSEDGSEYQFDTTTVTRQAGPAGSSRATQAHFAAPEVEAKVRSLSPTVYRLLLEHAQSSGVRVDGAVVQANHSPDSTKVNQ